jgi:hypothetical protein
MIKIEITDPQVLDEKHLVATARYLLNLAGHELATRPMVAMQAPIQNTTPYTAPPKKLTSNAPLDEVALNDPLDSEGNAWNPEIHSRTKSKTADGKWRLKQRMNVANQPVVSPSSSVPTPPIEPIAIISDPRSAIYVEPAINRQGVLPKHEPREDGTKLYLPEHDVVIEKDELEEWRKPYEVTFDSIMKKITPLITKKIITNQEIFTIVQSFGIETLFKMSERDDLLPAFDDELNKLIEKNENERKK